MANERTEVVCDICGRLFMEFGRNYHCDHCKKFFYVCPSCVDRHAKCRFCGIYLKKKRESVRTVR